MKLLIVEDNAEMRRLITHIVRKLSNSIYECADGSEALAAYREYLPDWVLMDVEMPLTDGISATRQIVKDFPQAKIAIVTDYDNQTLRRAAAEAGARCYVTKTNLVELRQMLAQ